jgi:hypothetical protein
MKTQSSEVQPSITITVSCSEAGLIWAALSYYRDHSPRHPDCGTPNVHPVLAAIEGSIITEHPSHPGCFLDFNREHYRPGADAPIPNAQVARREA